MIQEIKLKELKHIDFHIIYHAAKGLAEEKAMLYSALKQPDTLKDYSILQECIFLVQKNTLQMKRAFTRNWTLKEILHKVKGPYRIDINRCPSPIGVQGPSLCQE